MLFLVVQKALFSHFVSWHDVSGAASVAARAHETPGPDPASDAGEPKVDVSRSMQIRLNDIKIAD